MIVTSFTLFFQTHLSDSAGMPILAYLLWQAADRQLAEPEPEPHVAPIPTCPYRPRFATQVVVKGIEPQPRPAANPDGWITVVNGQKVYISDLWIGSYGMHIHLS